MKKIRGCHTVLTSLYDLNFKISTFIQSGFPNTVTLGVCKLWNLDGFFPMRKNVVYIISKTCSLEEAREIALDTLKLRRFIL